MENLKEILATPKQIGLLLGAGVSKACGLPNIEDITKTAKAGVTNANFNELLDDNDTVENILNKTQQLKTLLGPTGARLPSFSGARLQRVPT